MNKKVLSKKKRPQIYSQKLKKIISVLYFSSRSSSGCDLNLISYSGDFLFQALLPKIRKFNLEREFYRHLVGHGDLLRLISV
jgi:hypothetical protein